MAKRPEKVKVARRAPIHTPQLVGSPTKGAYTNKPVLLKDVKKNILEQASRKV